ncbi:MAG: hydrogenase [Nitrospirae bacterium]|nr:hydrogenase [Nitrospirota bacterium]
MPVLVNGILIALILVGLLILGASRMIRLVALQGALLSLMPLLITPHGLTWRVAALSLGSMILKGIVFPRLLFRAVKHAQVRRELQPYVGYSSSMVIGMATLAASFWLGGQLPLPGEAVSDLVLPAALFTILSGLFLVVARRKALTQVLGFLVLENGIFTFGVAVVGGIPFLIELGVLMDVFVAVFVMGIALQQINQAFEHIDADQMNSLKG